MGFILQRDTVSRISQELRSDGKKVVFTHGTFDLLHVGHITFLEKSKKLGDCLIVGVESDKRVKKYKGSARPVVSLNQRMNMLSSLQTVDFVFAIGGA